MDEEEQQAQPPESSTPEPEEDPEASTPEEGAEDGGGPSLYNFDLESAEGVDRIVALLPIISDELVKSIYQECFPGYPLDSIAPRMARIELRGFFMDFLDGEKAA